MVDETRPQPSQLTKEQRIGFLLLLIFAILAVGLGVLQIRNTLYAPFALNNKVPALHKEELTGPEMLRFRDTDRDGLNDFDELYVYTTSAYLADSDSDGLTDKQEVERGSDPNCVEGKICAGSGDESSVVSSTSTLLSSLGAEPGVAPNTVDLNQALQDPAQIRAMLKSVGLKDEMLQKISDADLMKLVTEVMMSSSTFSGAMTGATGTAP